MKVIFDGEPKEIAALVAALQGRQITISQFVPETADGPCVGRKPVTATACP